MTSVKRQCPSIFEHARYWAEVYGIAPQLPMMRTEMDKLGWDSCDVILVTGDAYVDLPSFGMAVVGRVLEAQGFRVGIIAQPDWKSADAFRALGAPNLFWGVTSGNMDSMVNHYTSERRIRSNDAYTPNGAAGRRPDRAVTVYAQRCREAFKGVPVVIGGIEASLRRIAHYDYWADKVRRSVLPDSKADLLVFGNGERQIIEIAHRLGRGEAINTLTDIRGTAFMRRQTPDGWFELDCSVLAGDKSDADKPVNLYPAGFHPTDFHPIKNRDKAVIRLPSFEAVSEEPLLYAHASRLMHLETNPANARALIQRHGERDVWLNPSAIPLTTKEMDYVFDLPYSRTPHVSYGAANIPAYEMIRFSINIMRGCFGGCTFCSITEHEGRIIQNRSEDSIVREVEAIRDKTPGFTGTISDLGGPTANMYRLSCKSREIEAACRKPSCVFPDICTNLNTDHAPLIRLYRRVRDIPGVKKVFIASGLRFDLAVKSPAYVRELVTHHVGGRLKIAPEHTQSGPLSKMMKPGIGAYESFRKMFDRFSEKAGKKQYLIPYFIAAHPGTTDEDMLQLSLWLKANEYQADQVQAFLPSPMSSASAMYYSGKNVLKKIGKSSEVVYVPKRKKQRDLHKAFLRYHDPDNWPLLRKALRHMGRADLIGESSEHLVPTWQPKDSAQARGHPRGKPFRTRHTKADRPGSSRPASKRRRR